MLRRALLVLAVFFAAFFTALPAGAQEITEEAPAVAPVAVLELSSFTVLVITSLLIPFLTGLATRLQATATVKQIVTAFISAIVGIVTTSTQVDGTAVISLATLQYAMLAFFIATVGYLGLYKPHQADAKLTPDRGILKLGPIG